MARLNQYAAAKGVSMTVTLSAEDQRAPGLIPVRKTPAPTGFGGGGGGAAAGGPPVDPAEQSRQQYNAMEMRGFADGKRSVLNIRNALSAEYGPQPIARVIAFFDGLAKTWEFELQPAK